MNKDMVKFLVSLLLFGSNGVVAAQIALPSYDIVVLRTLLGSVILGVVFLLGRKSPKTPCSRRGLVLGILSGMCMGISWIFLFEAYVHIGVGFSTVVYYGAPVLVMALSPLLFKERIALVSLVGLALVVAGILVLNATGSQGAVSGQGFACAMAAALFFACMLVCSKKSEGIEGVEKSLVQLVSAFATSAIATGFLHGLDMQIHPADALPILVLGLVNTGLGCYLYFSSIGALKAQTIAVCGYLEPVSAVVMACLLLGESMSAFQMAGAAMVVVGAATSELMPSMQRRLRLARS